MSWNSSAGDAQFDLQPFASVLGLLPSDSWFAKYYKPEDTDQVAIYHGDLTLENLDLDWGEDQVVLLLIQGNLTVKGNIFNENTDGAIGLMVFGDLSAKNMAVGGQEIYVTGNLRVTEVVCGSYNHGETIVKGDLEAAVLIGDDYEFQIGGEKQTSVFFDGLVEYPLFQGLPISLREVLVEDAFVAHTTFMEGWFRKEGLVELLRDGKSPLQDFQGYLGAKVTAIFSYFPDNLISKENMAKLTDCILMPPDKTGFGIEEKALVFRVNREHRDEKGQLRDATVSIDDGDYVFFIADRPEKIDLYYQKKPLGDNSWLSLETETELFNRCFQCWEVLLTAVCMAQHYDSKKDVRLIDGVMAHPEIQVLNPEDNDGLWNGECFYRFREFDGYPIIDIQTPNYVRYYYQNRKERVVRYYKLNNDHTAEVFSCSDLYHWERSQKYFEDFARFIKRELKLEEVAG